MFNKPIIIAVLGVDGAGKSTLISNLNQFFKSINIKSKSYHFSPSFIGNNINDLPVINPYLRNERSSFFSILKLIYIVLKYNLFLYIYYHFFLRDIKVLIFDRYFYDIAVDKLRYRVKLSKNFIFKFFRFIPEPDLLLFINTNIENCNKRSEDKIDNARRLNLNYMYSSLYKYSKNFHEINGNQSINEIYKDVKELIKNFNHSSLHNKI